MGASVVLCLGVVKIIHLHADLFGKSRRRGPAWAGNVNETRLLVQTLYIPSSVRAAFGSRLW
jgi:hypothetical protein